MPLAYGSFVVLRDIRARIRPGAVFVIMGGSGCGKSTLLRALIGLRAPTDGEVLYDGIPFWGSGSEARHGAAAVVWRVVPEWRTLEFDDLGREHRAGAG